MFLTWSLSNLGNMAFNKHVWILGKPPVTWLTSIASDSITCHQKCLRWQVNFIHAGAELQALRQHSLTSTAYSIWMYLVHKTIQHSIHDSSIFQLLVSRIAPCRPHRWWQDVVLSIRKQAFSCSFPRAGSLSAHLRISCHPDSSGWR